MPEVKPNLLIQTKAPPSLQQKLQAQFNCFDIRKGIDQVPSEVLEHCEIMVAGGESRVDQELMHKLPKLRLISNVGVGYDGIDLNCAKARGIAVTNTPDVLSGEVADLCVALMLSLSRRLPEADAYVRSGRWESEGPFPLTCRMSKTRAGIVGLGRIGREIVKRLKAFDMEIAFYGHHDEPGVQRMPSLLELAAFADYLIVCVPGRPENKNLIDAKVLQALGPNGRLINIARGSVVDEEALTTALEQGVIAGAGLDVFAQEPKVGERLCKLTDRTVLLPHVGSATAQTRQAMGDLVWANIEAYLSGKPLLTLVPELKG